MQSDLDKNSCNGCSQILLFVIQITLSFRFKCSFYYHLADELALTINSMLTNTKCDGISHVVFVWRTVRTASLLSAQHLCCRTAATTGFYCKDCGRQHISSLLTARTACCRHLLFSFSIFWRTAACCSFLF